MSLVAEGLVKTYRRRAVVNGVSLRVERGEIVGLLGPNGAGKTTTFYMMIGLIRPDGGRVSLDERDLTSLPMDQRARLGIGFLAQERSIFRKMTVEDNLLVIPEIHEPSRSKRQERLEELLADFHIAHPRRQKGMELSGGKARRVEVARSMAASPSFLLLDEPFSGVDPIVVQEFQQIPLRLKQQGLGILLTDHNVRDTLQVADRAYILSDGQIQVEGPSGEVARSPLARQFYLGENFVWEGRRPLQAKESGTSRRSSEP